MRLAAYLTDLWSAANFGLERVRTREMGTIAGLAPPWRIITPAFARSLVLILRTALGELVRK